MTVIHRISHAPAPAHHNRAGHGCPAVIGDGMAPVQSMLDGKLYDSKRALRSTYKAAGVTEVGGDPAMFRRPAKAGSDRTAVKAAVGRAFSRAGFGA